MDGSAILLVQTGSGKLPYFAEYPYFVWGEVNYDSDGNCQRPTDRDWSILYVHNRETGDEFDLLEIVEEGAPRVFEITGGNEETVRLAAYLTALRSGGSIVDPTAGGPIDLGPFAATLDDLPARVARAERVCHMFCNPDLAPLDTMAWWGGWKWVGPFATDFTETLRYVMMGINEHDAYPPLVDWLRRWWGEGPDPDYREGVRHALKLLTGEDPERPPRREKLQ